MMRFAGRYLTTVGGAIVWCALLGTDASAQATTVPISGQAVIVELVDPGTSFISEDGIEHVRNRVLRFVFFAGDLLGEQIVTVNSEQDLATGEGRSHGVASFAGTHVPSGTQGTFEGAVTGDISPDPSGFCGVQTQTRAFGHQGGGGFEGMKRSFEGTLTCPGFFLLSYEGQILDPSGTLQP